MADRSVPAFLRERTKTARFVTSVCTGARVLGAAFHLPRRAKPWVRAITGIRAERRYRADSRSGIARPS